MGGGRGGGLSLCDMRSSKGGKFTLLISAGDLYGVLFLHSAHDAPIQQTFLTDGPFNINDMTGIDVCTPTYYYV